MEMDFQQPGTFVKPQEVIKRFQLKEGSRFVDLGSGSGAYVLLASPLVGNTGQVYAVDIQKDLLLKLKNTATKSELENIKYLWTDFEKLGATKIPDETVDIVLISNTLFQLHDKRGALQEAYRILKIGGSLVIIDWTESFNGMGPDKNLIVSKEDAGNMAGSAGFVFDSEFTPGAHHYGLIFNKK